MGSVMFRLRLLALYDGTFTVYAVIMIVIQFIQFVTALRQSGKRLLSVCVIYFPVMFSLFILSMYAVIGVVLLFIIKFALSVMEENSRK